MKYVVELYEDPDRYSRWDVIRYSDPDSNSLSVGEVLHAIRGNDRYAEKLAHQWLEAYLKELEQQNANV